MITGTPYPQTISVPRKNRNALHATGPRTPDGKAASSRNAIKHGLTARQTVIPGENQADFDQLLADIAAERKPQGELETQMVGEIAACLWRLARGRAREAEILECDGQLFSSHEAPGFDRLVRYMYTIERQLNRAIVRLQQLQAERRRQPESAPNPEPKPMAAAAGASSATTYGQGEFVSSTDGRPSAAQVSTVASVSILRSKSPETTI